MTVLTSTPHLLDLARQFRQARQPDSPATKAFRASQPPRQSCLTAHQAAILRGEVRAKKTSTPATRNTPAPAENTTQQTRVATAVALERTRAAHIYNIAARLGKNAEWTSQHIKAGTPINEIDAMAKEKKNMTQLNSGISVGLDRNLGTIAEAISDALVAKAGIALLSERAPYSAAPPTTRAPHDRSREFAGRSLVRIAEAWLNAHGVNTDGKYPAQIAAMAMNPSASGLHTTSDFTDILANVSNKSLRAGYAEHNRTWEAWARRASAPNFKPISRKSLSGFATPPVVREGAEYTYATASDTGESYVLVKYGHIFGISWETLLGDDLDAFTRVPERHGMAAARVEDDLAYAILTGNQVMAEDGVVLFHADHSNLAGTGTALSVATLAAGRAAMRKQTGLAGERIDLVPSVLLVPVELETTAEQIISSLVDPTKANATPNPFSNRLATVASPRLDDASTTAWHLVASTGQVDTAEVAFLEGYDEPVVEQADGFSSDSRQFKVRHAVAARAIDHRGFYKNPGA